MTSSLLQNAVLKTSKDGESLPASKLWQDGPVLVVVLRRPGCLLCREQAIKIWNARDTFAAAGVKLVCIVREWIDREIHAFAPEYWGGELYYDEESAFYKAAHGGKLAKANLLSLLNPFSAPWKAVRRASNNPDVKDHNLKGDGLTLGGLLILKRDGEIFYSYPEKTLGDHAPFDEVIAAAQKVGSKN